MCSSETGNCVADPDHCINSGCPEWEHCDVASGNCIIDTGRCNLDSQCGGGTPACNTETHYCVECFTNQHCETDELCDQGSNTCVDNPNYCSPSNDICPDGYVCNFGNGECVCSSPPCDCVVDADCAWDQECIDGHCITNEDACQSHSDCQLYWERCVDNRCSRSCTPINRDCGDGSSSCDCTCCYGLTCKYEGFPEFDYQCEVP